MQNRASAAVNQYVHDETVKGMNAGKDVFTLMQEIKLPAKYDLTEIFGKVSWSVRGIYDGYAGWYDGNPSSMYELGPSTVYPDLVRLAGGVPDLAFVREIAILQSLSIILVRVSQPNLVFQVL